jgi:phage baseplate assembly protein W
MDNKKFLGTDLLLVYKSPTGMCEGVDLKKEYRYSSMKENIKGRLYHLSHPIFGKSYEELEDIATVTEIDNLQQSLINRIMTKKGELDELGHPEYGSKHHDLIGEPNTESNRNLIKFYILECLSHEPRIERILRTQVKTDTDNRGLVRIYLEIKTISFTSPINLIIPFSFEV